MGTYCVSCKKTTANKNSNVRRTKKNISDCNWTRTYNHLVHNHTLNHLAKPAK